MEWIRSLNEAIDYIEDNLIEKLTCKKISDHIYISSYHFQRVFSLLTGMTVGEYIRKRRLSLAGQELAASNAKVIDIALKYGYETPESFTKAFTRFHGVTPNKARLEGTSLKSFNRLIVKVRLEGGNIMDYKIVKKDSFNVLVKSRKFTLESGKKGIPEFWNEYHLNGLDKKICGRIAICEQEKVECRGEFSYSIGCDCRSDAKIPDGFKMITVPAYTWAVFKCIGPVPDAVQSMWKRIYSEWLPQSEYELIPDCDIEVYTDGDNKSSDYLSKIMIPVSKK